MNTQNKMGHLITRSLSNDDGNAKKNKDNFSQIKPEKSGSTVKTVRLLFNELKMQAVFTRENKRLSRL